jgi:hypothetical protein
MCATASQVPVAALANDIAAARTFADLTALRSRLKSATGILPEERLQLQEAIMAQEQSIIRLYTGRNV